MAFVFRLRSKIKVAHCKFSDLESILYFWPRGSLDAIYLREGSITISFFDISRGFPSRNTDLQITPPTRGGTPRMCGTSRRGAATHTACGVKAPQ